MSASPIMLPRPRLHVLPRVWATASLAAAAERVEERKRPHCVRAIQPAQPVPLEAPRIQRNPEPGLAFYRKYTEGLLRRYMKMSMEHGRTPSLLGRELFQTNVTNYKVQAFDDSVIFVHDVGRCLEQLDPGLRHLVRRIALEGHTQEEVGAMTGICLRTIRQRYHEALDKLTRVMLVRGILQPNMALLEED
jgi:Sigma-70, region 4